MKNFVRKTGNGLGLVTELTLVVLLCALVVSANASQAGDDAEGGMASIRPEAIRADMRFLADDLLESRGTGTRGHEISAKFMASQFEEMGVEPAGDQGTYYQNGPFALLGWTRRRRS